MDKITNDTAEGTQDEVSIKDLLLKIKRALLFILSKWKIILLAGVIGGGAGLAYSFIKKPIYKAELNFALQEEGSGSGLTGALGLASQFGLDLGGGAGGEFTGDNVLQLMRSRFVVEKTLLSAISIKGKKETLADLYIDFNEFRDKWNGKPELEKLQYPVGEDRSKFTLTQDSMLRVFYKDLLLKNVTIEKIDKKLSIISITINSKNEIFSKSFAEVMANVISEFYVQTKTKKSQKNVAVLQKQTDSVRRELYSGLSGVASSLDAAPNANPALQSLHVPSQRRQVDVQVNSAVLSELVKNLEIAKMSLLQETPLIQIIDRPIMPLENDRSGKLKGIAIGVLIGMVLATVSISMNKFFKMVMS